MLSHLSGLYMLGINPLLAVSIAHSFFHSAGFVVVYGFLCCAEAFTSNKAPLVYFCFSFLCFRRRIQSIIVIYVKEGPAYVFL